MFVQISPFSSSEMKLLVFLKVEIISPFSSFLIVTIFARICLVLSFKGYPISPFFLGRKQSTQTEDTDIREFLTQQLGKILIGSQAQCQFKVLFAKYIFLSCFTFAIGYGLWSWRRCGCFDAKSSNQLKYFVDSASCSESSSSFSEERGWQRSLVIMKSSFSPKHKISSFS